ncbi:MAG: hypothetical protein E7673_03390 [Ruminococcaceae bacterium]|nr:hypothetical protein [Oscillospiraceae bacterium]
MKRLLVLILCSSLLLFYLSSCMVRVKFKLCEDENDIVSINISEVNYDVSRQYFRESVILKIDDTHDFMKRIHEITYKISLYGGPRGIEFNSLAVKISYSNGNYEVFDDSLRSVYDVDDGWHDLMPGSFDKKKFDDFLFGYIGNLDNQSFNYMRDKEDIVKIEIVETADRSSDDTVLCEIGDKDSFIKDFENLDYTYVNRSQNSREGNRAVKIFYSDGSNEQIWYHYRVQHANDNAVWGSYIGAFNEEQFNALIAKYVG